MAEPALVKAELRDRAGKGMARATRRNGRVPAVIYGNKTEPTMISIDAKQLFVLANNPSFFNHLVDIELDGKKQQVLPRDVQLDPVTDKPVHVDFLRVSPTTRVTVHVPAEFVDTDKCPGLRRGGVLNIVRRDVELRCAPGSIPEKLSFSLEGLEIGASIHINAIKLPDGVTPTTARNFTVATIAAPTLMTEETGPAAAAATAEGAAAPAAGEKKEGGA